MSFLEQDIVKGLKKTIHSILEVIKEFHLKQLVLAN